MFPKTIFCALYDTDSLLQFLEPSIFILLALIHFLFLCFVRTLLWLFLTVRFSFLVLSHRWNDWLFFLDWRRTDIRGWTGVTARSSWRIACDLVKFNHGCIVVRDFLRLEGRRLGDRGLFLGFLNYVVTFLWGLVLITWLVYHWVKLWRPARLEVRVGPFRHERRLGLILVLFLLNPHPIKGLTAADYVVRSIHYNRLGVRTQ